MVPRRLFFDDSVLGCIDFELFALFPSVPFDEDFESVLVDLFSDDRCVTCEEPLHTSTSNAMT